MSSKTISTDLDIKCPRCKKSNKIAYWDNNSYRQCYTRVMRRKFKSLRNKAVFKNKNQNYYLCPDCNKWIPANCLIILSNDKELSSLGRNKYIEKINII